MKLYRIRDWNKLFENSQSRKIDSLSWVPVPNKHDGEGFRTIMAEPDGIVIYGAWHLILQVASKCEIRGTLSRRAPSRLPDGSQSATSPLSAKAIALKVGWDKVEDIQRALDFCSSDAVGWIEVVEFNPTPIPPDSHLATTPLPPDSHSAGLEGKGTEGKEQKEPEGTTPNTDAHIPTLEEVRAFAVSPNCGFYPDRVEEWYHDQQACGWKYANNGKGWKSRMLSDRNREFWRKRNGKEKTTPKGPNI